MRKWFVMRRNWRPRIRINRNKVVRVFRYSCPSPPPPAGRQKFILVPRFLSSPRRAAFFRITYAQSGSRDLSRVRRSIWPIVSTPSFPWRVQSELPEAETGFSAGDLFGRSGPDSPVRARSLRESLRNGRSYWFSIGHVLTSLVLSTEPDGSVLVDGDEDRRWGHCGKCLIYYPTLFSFFCENRANMVALLYYHRQRLFTSVRHVRKILDHPRGREFIIRDLIRSRKNYINVINSEIHIPPG